MLEIGEVSEAVRKLVVVLLLVASAQELSGCFLGFYRNSDRDAELDIDDGDASVDATEFDGAKFIDADDPDDDGAIDAADDDDGVIDAADIDGSDVMLDADDADAMLDADDTDGDLRMCRPVTPDGWDGDGTSCMGASYLSGTRSWPVATDATGPDVDGVPGCTDSGGAVTPSVGADAAPWFGYLDCGSWKELSLGEGCSLTVVTTNDCCETCALLNIHFHLEVDRGWGFEEVATVRHDFDPTAGPAGDGCVTYVDHFDRAILGVDGTARIRLADGEGYACAYQE